MLAAATLPPLPRHCCSQQTQTSHQPPLCLPSPSFYYLSSSSSPPLQPLVPPILPSLVVARPPSPFVDARNCRSASPPLPSPLVADANVAAATTRPPLPFLLQLVPLVLPSLTAAVPIRPPLRLQQTMLLAVVTDQTPFPFLNTNPSRHSPSPAHHS